MKLLNPLRSDESLMLRYAGGDVAAFDDLYRRHKDRLYRFVRGSVGTAAIAEELAQETWEAVIGAAAGYQHTAAFTTWLFTIARRKLVDHFRRTERSVPEDDQAVDQQQGAAHLDPARQYEARQLLSLISELPAEQREALLLKEEGFSLREIAALVGAGEETVKSRIRYARDSLRESLGVTSEGS